MARSNAVQCRINKEKYKSRGIWKVVNSISSANSKIKNKFITLKINNRLTTEPTEIADIFSDVFNKSESPGIENQKVALTS